MDFIILAHRCIEWWFSIQFDFIFSIFQFENKSSRNRADHIVHKQRNSTSHYLFSANGRLIEMVYCMAFI